MKYKGKEVKIIQEYENFVLIEHEKGYRECVSRHELGLIKEIVPANKKLNMIHKI